MGDAVSLGVRRLSIIDVPGSNQPICERGRRAWSPSSTARSTTTAQLRALLEARATASAPAATPRCSCTSTRSTATAGVHALRGMFAYAVWDLDRRALVLARDRLGIKPLYYAERGGRLAFASELKAVLVDPEVDRDARSGGAAPLPRPPVRAGRAHDGPRRQRLPPGHLLVWRDGRVEPAALLGPRPRGGRAAPRRADRRRGVSRAGRGVGRAAPRQRRAARRPAVGRHRLGGGDRHAGAPGGGR